MANEITVNIYGACTNGKYSTEFKPGQLQFTQTTQGAQSGIVSVGTSEEDMGVGDVATNGWLFIRNLDTANYVVYGPKSGGAMVAFGRIRAGEVAAFRLSAGVTLRWQANTAAVKVHTILLED